MPNDTDFKEIRPFPPEKKKFFTVSFNICRNRDTPNPVEVLAGMTIEKPEDPAKPGCDFAGWYIDRQHTKLFNFKLPVNADMTLYAKWVATEATYDLIFHDYPAYPDSTVVPVKHGQTAPKMEDPIKKGCTFLGWYLNDVPVEDWFYLFDTPVTEDLYFFPMWEENFKEKDPIGR
jgi:uncharacterized repeat protein (TIGR02543 family)